MWHCIRTEVALGSLLHAHENHGADLLRRQDAGGAIPLDLDARLLAVDAHDLVWQQLAVGLYDRVVEPAAVGDGVARTKRPLEKVRKIVRESRMPASTDGPARMRFCQWRDILASNEALDAENRVLRVVDGGVNGRFADEAVVRGERDDRRHRAVALVVGDDLDLAVAEHTDARVGGAEVDANGEL